MDGILQTITESRETAFLELPEPVRFYIECELETFTAQGFQPITYEELQKQQGPIYDAVVLIASEHKASRNSWRASLGFYVDTFRRLQNQPSEHFTDGQRPIILDNCSSTRAGIPSKPDIAWNQIQLNRSTTSELRLIYGATGSFEYNSGITQEGFVDYHAITDLVWILQRPDATKIII